jgi:NAD-dependent deacetylase
LHGNIERSYCMTCGEPAPNVALPERGQVPRCPACGGVIRPDVVWFGEMLPEDVWEGATSAADNADVFLSIGTSAVVYPAASLPLMAKQRGAYLVEVNTEPTPLTGGADEFLRGPSGTILPLLYASVAAGRTRMND